MLRTAQLACPARTLFGSLVWLVGSICIGARHRVKTSVVKRVSASNGLSRVTSSRSMYVRPAISTGDLLALYLVGGGAGRRLGRGLVAVVAI